MNKMDKAVKVDGSRVYTLATGVSLLIFYVLAMQCMSTLAIVKRETGTWKWPVIQLLYMTGLAYVLSYIAYFLLR
jgi:ferrous iron transport protein B